MMTDQEWQQAAEGFFPFPESRNAFIFHENLSEGFFCFLSPEATILEEKRASEEVFFLTLLLLLLAAGSRLIF